MPMAELIFATRRLGVVSGLGQFSRGLASGLGGHPASSSGQEKVDKLWQKLFSDPSQWWDHRWEKVNTRYPDFKHKETHEALWLNGKLKPTWVDANLAAMAPGTVQLNRFSWNARLARHIKAREPEKTIAIFQEMQQEGMKPDGFSFVQVLNACASLQLLEEGKRVHSCIMQSEWAADVFVGNSLIDMYSKCMSIDDASTVFSKMPMHDVVSWNTMIGGYVKCGQGLMALKQFQQMQMQEVKPDPVTFVGVVNACTSIGAFEEGLSVHQQIIQSGCESNVFVGTSLVDMYVKHGSLEDAWSIFNKMPTHNVVCWNAMILGHVKCGKPQEAFELFGQMQEGGLEPVPVTFVGLLKACASLGALEDGRRVHRLINESGYETDVLVGSSLVDMYAKCGSIEDSWEVFNKMPSHDVVSWNALLLGYVKCGQGQKAMELYQQMQQEDVMPDPVTFVGVLSACASTGALKEGRSVHEHIIQSGSESDIFIASSLINMYTKCGSMEDAERVFQRIPTRDVVCWNAMILGYVKCGQAKKALVLFQQMGLEGVEPVPATFVGVLNACASVKALEEGRHVHEQIIQHGCESDVFVSSSLVDMYAKCGRVEDARRVFDMLPKHDVVSWNAMIMGHVKCGQGQEALQLSREMLKEGVNPVPITFVAMVNACAGIGALDQGRCVHEQIIQTGCEQDVYICSSLIDMYAKCGSLEEAWRVFNKIPTPDVVCWNSMILGHVRSGEGKAALQLFQRMQKEGVDPVPDTLVAIVKACSVLQDLNQGRCVHELTIQSGWDCNIRVATSLVDMYIKCGSTVDARSVFRQMPTQDLVAWNSLILGHVRLGEGQKSLELYQQMHRDQVKPDPAIFSAVLNACSSIGALEEGRHIHKHIIDHGADSDAFVCSSLIDMYGNCGNIEDAQRVFNGLSVHDLNSWNALLLGHVKCGEGRKALELFGEMQAEGVKPDPITFVHVLKSCCSIGALKEGRQIHDLIIQSDWESDVFLGTSLLDMYAKCGSIEDAGKVFTKMPNRSAASWNAMLGGYVMHGHVREAIEQFECMCESGIGMDHVTFTHLLSACCYDDLVDTALGYFSSMSSVYSVSATVEHCTLMVNLLCNGGRLHEAEDILRKISCAPTATMWTALLYPCKRHRNSDMELRVQKKIFELDQENTYQ